MNRFLLIVITFINFYQNYIKYKQNYRMWTEMNPNENF